jgi:hypothetical protein
VSLRLGEKLVLVGAGMIAAFAVLVGTLIYLKPPPVRYVYLESVSSRSGEMVFRRQNCLTCHELFGNGTTYGPPLDGIGSRRTVSWLREYLRAPRAGVSAKPYRVRMPPFDTLPPGDLRALVSYLRGLRELDAEGAIIDPPPA